MKGGVSGWILTCTEITVDIMGPMLSGSQEAQRRCLPLSSLSTQEAESPSQTLRADRALGLLKGLKCKGPRILKACALSTSSALFKMYLIWGAWGMFGRDLHHSQEQNFN